MTTASTPPGAAAPLPSQWETVCDEPWQRVRRIAVPGGWLYQVQLDIYHEPLEVSRPGSRYDGWQPPVFVADPDYAAKMLPRVMKSDPPW